MSLFKVTVAQQFFCTYIIEANNQEDAWDELMNGNGNCVEQDPDEIIDEPNTAYWETN